MKLCLPAALLASLAFVGSAFGEIKSTTVPYKDGNVELEGFVAFDDAKKGIRPGVLVIHDWTGLQDYAKTRANQLAEPGYVAFAADIYGTGIRPVEPEQCAIEAGKYKNDLPLLRRRVQLALEQLKLQPNTDPEHLAAIGYCFGGTSVLELARSGADVDGVVSFHGGLATKMPAEAGKVKGRVLVLHGAADPYVKPDEVAAFKEEMQKANVKLQFVAYPDAVHSFTKKGAGNDPSKGNAYNEAADKQSWAEMKKFFGEILDK
jgi:dienelactone hydrolase